MKVGKLVQVIHRALRGEQKHQGFPLVALVLAAFFLA
jgi:hypothetical protein